MTRLPELKDKPVLAVDCETRDPNLLTKGPGAIRDDGYCIGVALSWRDEGFIDSVYLPFAHEGGGNMDWELVRSYLNDQLSCTSQPKVFANAAYDLDWLRHFGVKVAGPKYDIQIADPLLNENHRTYKLDALAERHLGQHKATDSLVELAVRKLGVKADKVMGELWRLPADDVTRYAKTDTELTLQVWEKQKPLLEERGLWKLFETVETPLIDMLFDMRWYGVQFDVDEARRLQHELAVEEDEHKRTLVELGVAPEIELWSAANVATAAESIGLEVPRNARGMALIAAPWLKSQTHPFWQCILKMRRANRAGSSAIQNLIDFTHNGWLHPQFWQSRHDRGGTVSGRFSCSNPNLQQIHSRDGTMKPRMRGLFKPDAGMHWLSCDYSQAEPRITVHYAAKLGLPGAEEAMRAYIENPDQDYHQL
ncbi:MAG: DNA polymerase, partial [Nitrososphaera sp.]|nr:DNA polymerase [Nitrososphaera sp.]